jgi:hypothetical protein
MASKEQQYAWHKEWRERNKADIKCRNKSYHEANQEKMKTACLAYYYAHKDNMINQVKEWRKNNPQKLKEYVNSRIKNLSDAYIKQLLRRKSITGLKNIPQELIEIKRLQVKIKRIVYEDVPTM